MEIAESNSAMWRGALWPAIVTSVISTVISVLISGGSGLWGALLASFTVVIFFSVSLLVARLTKNADPISTMALAMFSYFTKLLLMAGFLIAVTRLTDPDAVNRRAFGASALAVALAWLAGEVRAFFRLRLQLPLPGASQDGSTGEKEKR
jgi:ATP synthase protein I